MTIHHRRCIESPRSSTNTAGGVAVVALSVLGGGNEVVLAVVVMDVGKADKADDVEDGERVGKRDAFGSDVEEDDGVADVEGVGKGIAPASDAAVGKKLICLLTSFVMLLVGHTVVEGVSMLTVELLLPASSLRAEVALTPTPPSIVVTAGLLSRVVAFAITSLADTVGVLAEVVELEITPAAVNLLPLELGVENPVTGPAANLAFSTTATAIIPSADTSSSGTTALFILREMRRGAGVSPSPTFDAACFSLRLMGVGAVY